MTCIVYISTLPFVFCLCTVATLSSLFLKILKRYRGVKLCCGYMPKIDTVKPLLSGPLLSGHPLFSGQLSGSRKFCQCSTVNKASIKRSRTVIDFHHKTQFYRILPRRNVTAATPLPPHPKKKVQMTFLVENRYVTLP